MGVEKREPLYTIGGNVSWCSCYRKQWRLLRKVRTTYNGAIPLVGMYPNKTIIQKDICNPMFIATLFTIAETWQQPKYPSTDKWRKKMGAHIYSRILLSHKIERMPFAATWMQLEIIILSKKEKNTHTTSLTCGM